MKNQCEVCAYKQIKDYSYFFCPYCMEKFAKPKNVKLVFIQKE